MKQPWEWEEEDIEALVRDGMQESLTLDYKRCASLDRHNPNRKVDLSKDVSAFANSAGGVLIYGVKEENHLPIAVDIGYDPFDITREWLEQVINSSIQRRVGDIRIKQIELKHSNPGKVIYVVFVPQSSSAHQAADHRYYKRFNFESVPMEDYEVRDVMNRATTPDVSVEFSYRVIRKDGPKHEFELKVLVKNFGTMTANKFKLEFTFPVEVSGVRDLIRRRPHIQLTAAENGDYLIRYYSEQVLFPQDTVNVGEQMVWRYTIDEQTYEKIRQVHRSGKDLLLNWCLYADNMPRKQGDKRFDELHDY